MGAGGPKESYHGGKTIRLKAVVHNVEITDALFAVPEGRGSSREEGHSSGHQAHHSEFARVLHVMPVICLSSAAYCRICGYHY